MKKTSMIVRNGLMILPLVATIAITGCKKDDKSDDIPATIQFVFTSDAHYGITRAAFQGKTKVDAHVVNAAMVAQMNTLPGLTLPNDNGINAGLKINSVDYVLEAGDIANRMETSASVQTAASSWEQFKIDYLQTLSVKNSKGKNAELLIVPGNHDVSNTIGYYATMSPLTDATSMAGIYNLMFNTTTKTATNYSYKNDRINYSREIGGVHFCFIQMWPDSSVRIWLEKDLQNVAGTTPVIIVAHDQPAVVTNHFTNPNGDHSINNVDKFDNVLDEQLKDGTSSTGSDAIEQRAFVAFLKKHTNIKAYLHGHVHESKYYTYTGPDNDIALPTVGADSPMKGVVSSTDETKLTFHFGALDTKNKVLTMRECYWNPTPSNPLAAIQWGSSVNISLK